ncbi:hypothetical protein JCM19314_3724 [Nonlabens ulvanivorans]|uniref:Uncharacterized protein n=1 Tax=Nonlabens ulvanivorans TaxID=906888 RepID=A0A090Q9B7_NONUL|nr:hypothetical protein JCM19314_3724 [Nonlabens ulvanivorans]
MLYRMPLSQSKFDFLSKNRYLYLLCTPLKLSKFEQVK